MSGWSKVVFTKWKTAQGGSLLSGERLSNYLIIRALYSVQSTDCGDGLWWLLKCCTLFWMFFLSNIYSLLIFGPLPVIFQVKYISAKQFLSWLLHVTLTAPVSPMPIAICVREDLPHQIVSFFLKIFQTTLPPLVLNSHVADFSEGLLKKCADVCRDKKMRIVREMSTYNL